MYLDIDTTENTYAYWHIFASNYVEPILTATNSVTQCDGKTGTSKKLPAKPQWKSECE